MQSRLGIINGIFLCTIAAASVAGPSPAESGVMLVAQFETGAEINTDIVVSNGVAYVGEYSGLGGVHIIDVRDAGAPQELAVFRPSVRAAVLDVKLKDHYLFAAMDKDGVVIADVSDPANPREVTVFKEMRTYDGVHNLFITGDYAYMASEGYGELLIVDISDPTAPQLVSIYKPPGYTHDMTVVGDTAYLANLGFRASGMGTFQLVDVSDPANPQLIAQHDYPEGFCHNIWPSPDGRFVATTDEICQGGHVRIFDVSDVSRIRQVGEYMAADAESASVHNAKWVGNLVFMAYYTKGLRVIDVTDPTAPREVGAFGTWNGQIPFNPCFGGAWGVDTEQLGDGRTRVYLSDISTGLWIFDVATK